jgi:hypothetical protein
MSDRPGDSFTGLQGNHPLADEAGGQYVYRAPVKHHCGLPVSGANDGDVWLCDCNQAWKRKNHKWVKVTWPEKKEK